jgi:hypothetical protein
VVLGSHSLSGLGVAMPLRTLEPNGSGACDLSSGYVASSVPLPPRSPPSPDRDRRERMMTAIYKADIQIYNTFQFYHIIIAPPIVRHRLLPQLTVVPP